MASLCPSFDQASREQFQIEDIGVGGIRRAVGARRVETFPNDFVICSSLRWTQWRTVLLLVERAKNLINW